MRRWQIDPQSETWRGTAAFEAAVADLVDGRLLAVPTETVYGLAADATNALACADIYAAKGRPSFNPLIAHVESTKAAERHALFDARARALAKAFWPGPLTMVLPKRVDSPICDLATAGLPSVALRVPAAAIMRDLAQASGRPIAAPSANRSGRISGTTAEAVAGDLGDRLALLIDAGPTPVGVESTIVALTDERPRLLRPGGIERQAIEAVLGETLAPALVRPDDAPDAPGMLSSHYAPRAALRLEATHVEPDEALLAFGPDLPPGAEHARAVVQLSARGELREAAARLFTAMRELDASGAERIAAMPVPEAGLGEAINDRLRRAAAPRR